MARTVNVLLFAAYADALGHTSVDVPLADGSTVMDVLAALRCMPGADRLPPSPLVAINQRYAKASDVVSAGDEVAVILPVAGG